jgi:hypothetical protein
MASITKLQQSKERHLTFPDSFQQQQSCDIAEQFYARWW